MGFSDWITKKYISWRGNKTGSESTVTSYARYIGVPQQVMSDWMKKGGKVPKSGKYINKLAEHYPEIYDVLNLPRPNYERAYYLAPESPIDEKQMKDILGEVKLLMDNMDFPDLAEKEKYLKTILKKRGIELVSTHNETYLKSEGKSLGPRYADFVDYLAFKLGEDIYEFLGIAKPMESMDDLIDQLPPSFSSRLKSAIDEVDEMLSSRNLSALDPEAEQITKNIFEKYGFKNTSTETVPDDEPTPRAS